MSRRSGAGSCKELAQAPGREAIATLVPVTHGASAALLAGEELALPVLDYEHAGPDAIGTEYAALVDPFAQSLTPELPQGLNLGRQILWQQRAFPERFAKVTDILPYPQYWAFRLSGRKASEVTSLGCHTHLWRPRERTFGGLVERAGWRPLMPPLRPAFEPLGTIRAEVADSTSLDPTCRVLCGIHDSNASYLRHLARQAPPFTVVSSGTWVICMAAGGAQGGLDPARDMLANVDVNGDPVPCARFMGGREFALIAGRESGFAGCDAADLGALIEAGVMALPAFGGGSGPFGGRLGEIVPEPPHDPRARAALATLYTGLVTDFCLDLLQAQGPLIIEGSFVGNPVFPGCSPRCARSRACWSPTMPPARRRGQRSSPAGRPQRHARAAIMAPVLPSISRVSIATAAPGASDPRRPPLDHNNRRRKSRPSRLVPAHRRAVPRAGSEGLRFRGRCSRFVNL